LDIAKNVFQLHGLNAAGNVLLRKQLRRGDVLRFFSWLSPCLVGIEACATAHYWARELAKLGHTVRLMPPACVKPYVKRGKTDAADAEAIAEAVTRPTMRFVAVKTAERQPVLMLHKLRDLLVRQRTMLINAARTLGRVRHHRRPRPGRGYGGDCRDCMRRRTACPCWPG
jgi:transposase